MIDLHDLSQILIPVAHAAEAAAEGGKSGIVETLGLNGKLFVAQLFNFGVLMFILWKFVFGPVTKGLQSRTEKIEKSLQYAENVEKEKQEFTAWKNQEMAEARKQAAEIVNSAQAEASKLRDQMVQKTKEDQEKVVAQAKQQIESDKTRALQDAKAEIADLVTNATEKILRKRLDVKEDREYVIESLRSIK